MNVTGAIRESVSGQCPSEVSASEYSKVTGTIRESLSLSEVSASLRSVPLYIDLQTLTSQGSDTNLPLEQYTNLSEVSASRGQCLNIESF